MYEVREIEESKWRLIFPLMKELRAGLDEDRFIELVTAAREHDDYRLVGLVREDMCVAVMGLRVLYDLVHGKHLYIDDLVVTKDLRGQGLGAMLLKFARTEAERLGCQGLRLCTGIENDAGRRFYEREGWSARALAFKMKI